MASLFTRIINGEIPSYKVAEDEDFYAFLDVNPLKEGHTLVVPKKEVDYIFDIDDELLGKMMIFAKKVAAKIKEVQGVNKVGVVVIGLEVHHAHIHLIPLVEEGDIDFKKPRLKLTEQEFQTIAQQLQL